MTAHRHPLLVQPRDEQGSVWRYLDFTKYVSLLDSSALYLPRADRLGDPFEGTFGRGVPPLDPIETPGGQKSFVAGSMEHRPELLKFYRRLRCWTYVSCWHANEFESAAMWRLYASPYPAVAIRSSYAALCQALPENTFIGLVQYIDFDRGWVPDTNTIWPFFYKRISFEHEHEVRVVFQDIRSGNATPFRANNEEGKSIPLDLESIVREVIVAPTSPAWFKQLVSSVTARYGYEFPVNQSELDAQPLI